MSSTFAHHLRLPNSLFALKHLFIVTAYDVYATRMPSTRPKHGLSALASPADQTTCTIRRPRLVPDSIVNKISTTPYWLLPAAQTMPDVHWVRSSPWRMQRDCRSNSGSPRHPDRLVMRSALRDKGDLPAEKEVPLHGLKAQRPKVSTSS
jgi:hypothetical protein